VKRRSEPSEPASFLAIEAVYRREGAFERVAIAIVGDAVHNAFVLVLRKRATFRGEAALVRPTGKHPSVRAFTGRCRRRSCR
jgi:hypothetical protein